MLLSYMDKYISIRQVLDNIIDHPLLKDISLERAINYTQSFIRILGCPRIFEEKTAIVEIKDYRGLIPCDLNDIIQVRTYSEYNKEDYKVFRHTTDNFHMSENKQDSFDLTYKVQGNIIYTSIKEGTIEIVYNAFAVDSNGYPLIPDNSCFINALELYIKKKHFTILFDTGKLNQAVYNQVCQDYAWAVGQAQSDLVRPTIDQMQSLTNSLNNLIPKISEHNNGFINLGTKEKIRIQ